MPGPYFPDPAAEAIRDPAFSLVASADPNGSVLERLAQILSNFPISVEPLGYRNSPGPDKSLGEMTSIFPWAHTQADAAQFIGSGSSAVNQASVTAVYDTTLNRWYRRNNTGLQAHVQQAVGQFRPHPFGPGSMGLRVGYDLESGQQGRFLLPADIDCLAFECEGTFTAAIASDDTTFLGFTDGNTAAANGYANARRCFGVARRSGGSGWVLRTSDGTTASETAEAADTSDGNRHIFRIEWHGKATPEARLYVDNVLKVTKTTNLWQLDANVLLASIGMSVATGIANDTVRWYSHLMYWKNAA